MGIDMELASFALSDFCSWKTDGSTEIYRGEIRNKTAGTAEYTAVCRRLCSLLETELPAELQVLPYGTLLCPLAGDADFPGEIDTVVVPAISVVQSGKLRTLQGMKYYCGPPQLVVEADTASTWQLNRGLKQKLYALSEAGQYWILSPEKRTIQIFTGNQVKTCRDNDTIALPFVHRNISISEIF